MMVREPNLVFFNDVDSLRDFFDDPLQDEAWSEERSPAAGRRESTKPASTQLPRGQAIKQKVN